MRPDASRSSPCTALNPLSSAASASSACGSRRCPPAVRDKPSAPRRKSWVPNCASSASTWRRRVAWVPPICSAAARSEPFRATARKAGRDFQSMITRIVNEPLWSTLVTLRIEKKPLFLSADPETTEVPNDCVTHRLAYPALWPPRNPHARHALHAAARPNRGADPHPCLCRDTGRRHDAQGRTAVCAPVPWPAASAQRAVRNGPLGRGDRGRCQGEPHLP